MSFLNKLLDALLNKQKPSKPPTPPVQPIPDPPRYMHVSVWAPEGGFAKDIKGELRFDDPGWPILTAEVIDGRLRFELPVAAVYGWQVHLTVKAGKDADARFLLKDLPLGDADVMMPPKFVSMPVLEKKGQFYYQNGQPFSIIQCSDFRLYEYFLNQHDITAVLQDRKDLGFNTLRVWMLNTSVGHIVPSEHPDYYARIPEFMDLCARYGLYIEFTVFTQTQSLMPALSAQQAHFDQLVRAIGGRFCFVEGSNENDMHDNAYDPRVRFWKPAGATFDLCSGSNGSDAWVVEPVRDSARYHSNDADQWWRRAAHNGMEMADAFGVPAWPNENTRPDHDSNINHHHDAAMGAALLMAGYCYHSTNGKDSVVLTGLDRDCAVAVVQGMRSVDLNQRTGGYIHRTDLEGPTVVRAYQRGSAVVLIRA